MSPGGLDCGIREPEDVEVEPAIEQATAIADPLIQPMKIRVRMRINAELSETASHECESSDKNRIEMRWDDLSRMGWKRTREMEGKEEE